jgi:hypothetical protein
LVSAAGSCSSEQLSQKEVKRKEDMREQLATAYESCVRTSFASQLPTMVDRNTAIDQAFVVCQTEESKLHAFENLNVSNAAISTHRDTLKEELLRR